MRIEKNHVKHNPEITQAILDDMADALKNTYSPTGASTLMIQSIPSQDGTPTSNVRGSVSKDGSAAMSAVVYDNPVCMAIKRLCISAMTGVLQTAADGTTTTTLLLAEIYRNIRATKFYKEHKIPAQLLQDLITEVVTDIISAIQAVVKENPTTLEDVYGVVKTTVNADKEVYNVLASAIKEMLDKGCDLKNLAFRFDSDLTSGKSSYVVDTGYSVPDAVLGANLFGGFTLNECVVVMIDRSLQTAEQIRAVMNTMKGVAEVQSFDRNIGKPVRPIVFITEDIKYKNPFIEEYHKFMAGYREQNGVTPSVFILEYRADGSVLSRDEHDDFIQLLGQPTCYSLYEDYESLFAITLEDGKLPTKMVDYVVERYTADKLAKATVTIGKSNTIIKNVKSVGDNVLLHTLIQNLKDSIEKETSEIKKNEFKGRLYKLEGYYALVKIASDNEWDVRRKLDAVEDAVGAIKAVVNSSAVGGMSTLIPKVILNNMASYDLGTPEGSMKNEILTAILDSYKALFGIIMENSGMAKDKYFNDVVMMRNDGDAVKHIKTAVDVHKVLNSFRNGKDSFEDVCTTSVLNSSDAEIKILEATTKAASTLLGINQICLPDKYDAATYEGIDTLL